MSVLRQALLVLPLLLSLGCPPGDSGKLDDTAPGSVDADGDGYASSEDCDDSDPTIYPGAEETCDGEDNDCDGEVDETGTNTFYADTDGDGFGNPTSTVEDCQPPTGYVEDDSDCNDQDAEQHPGAEEYCNGEDDDCDDDIDEEAVDPATWYQDADGDGWGNEEVTAEACDQPTGHTEQAEDCDDEDADQHPGADEYCNGEDDDCDGEVDEDTIDAETTWYADDDEDGYGDSGDVIVQCTQPSGYVLNAEDCNDDDSSFSPAATEYCDGVDNDCDGTTDEDDATDTQTWYADTDEDGYGDVSNTTAACEEPSGYTDDSTDCDDADSSQYPGAYEYCNGEDDDCDGTTDEDEAVDADSWYIDTDGDGWGDDDITTAACDQPTGYVEFGGDCDDSDASINLGADEECNGVDDDCDGDVDEDDATDVVTWYADVDGDGYGDATTALVDCDQPSHWVADGTDCDDSDNSVNPGEDEVCNGVDDDCDGLTDEDDATDITTWYEDADGDGYGNDSVADIDCDQPSGWVAVGGDCDDTSTAYNPAAVEEDCTDPNDYNCDGSTGYTDVDGDGWAACEDCDDNDDTQYPGADEACNDEDDDCDGTVDEDSVDEPTWYLDTDGDGYGSTDTTDIGCDQPTGYVDNDDDCDDDDATVSPSATEWCDGEDDDCDGDIDEDDAFDASTWYADTDGDGFGDATSTDIECYQPSGHVDDDTDCDDGDASIYPGAEETCNGSDDDCDGTVDEDEASDVATWFADYDGDGFGDETSTDTDCEQPSGYVDQDGDCDDADASQYPGADEYCNGADDDCDGDIDEDAVDGDSWYADTDEDGYGADDDTETSCDQPSGYVANDDDCNDDDADQYPGADEYCNGEDDDCDGDTDEDDAVDVATWYADVDEDAYGDASDSDIDCDQPSGFVSDDTDCNDDDANQYPGADELCNGEDDDCDGDIDEDEPADAETWYADSDGDGFGDPDTATIDCEQPSDTIADGTDCDDSDASVNPDADETCDGVDNDCDGDTDEDDAIDTTTWYLDFDEDGYGGTEETVDACDQPSGYVSDNTDCNDKNDAQYPGADELCNGEDDDCDGVTDEDDAVDAETWYADTDSDGYGDAAVSDTACEQPSGYVADDTDCDDGDADQFPGADEHCNGEDDDCDGDTDEDDAIDADTWYADSDGDSFGDKYETTTACVQPTGYVSNETDCDDTDASQYPGADEVCNGEDDDCDDVTDEDDATDAATWYGDADGDGYGDSADTTTACVQPTGYVSDDTDCDDAEPDVNPDADELCDGVDNNCDGVTDEDDATDADTWYADSDGDGYGDDTSTTTACFQPTGYIAEGNDCDDSDASVFKGADELCDGVDNDCDGEVDEDDATDTSTWYADIDGDGYGDAASTTVACTQPSGYVTEDTDCDDADAAQYPYADELCNGEDDDCDGDTDEEGATDAPTWYEDADDDGYGSASTTKVECLQPSGYVDDDTDCDDGDAIVNPGADEVCDSVDNDCDGDTDEDDAIDAGVWYVDSDGDGDGDPATSDSACTQPTGYVASGSDCDDSDASVYTGAEELCDSVDNDCDGEVDEEDATDVSTWYMDTDGDGYGDPSTTKLACTQPTGYVTDDTDCNDSDPAQYPYADELCNGEDDDCDGDTDEGDATDAMTWYADADGDGYGDSSSTEVACTQPSDYVEDDTDCDDTDDLTSPGADEICDSADNDCDGDTDEDDAVDADTWYADSDGDGHGDVSTATNACTQPTGYVSVDTDCDDTDASIHEGAEELCDGIDNDCDGEADEEGATDGSTWYSDSDGDGYGDATSTTTACSQPSGHVSDDTDCDDADADTNPGAIEYCDSLDNNCDGIVDEDTAADAMTWYVDSDGDIFGDPSTTDVACTKPSGYTTDATDCDDDDSSINPDATEYCDSVDNDCDGTVDEDDAIDADTWYADSDGDTYGDASTTTAACSQPSGYVADDTDCDDEETTTNPGATETCDDVDNDCDGTVDEDSASDASAWYLDADGDDYGDASSPYLACDQPSGYVADDTDCDDAEPLANPGLSEVCNDGVDNDCDGTDNSCALSGTYSLASSDGILWGETASDSAGMKVRTAGDFDNDGYGDLLIGAPQAYITFYSTYWGLTSVDTGRAYVVYGPFSSSMGLGSADLEIYAESSSALAGMAAECAGDVNADGYDDILVGAVYDSSRGSYYGAAYLVNGPATGNWSLASSDATIYGVSASEFLGSQVSMAGDVNADGYDDFMVAGWDYYSSGGDYAGTTYLFHGPLSGSTTSSYADATFYGETAYDYSTQMGAYGDLTGDGQDDVVIASGNHSTAGSYAGRTYIVEGPVTGTVALSTADVFIDGEASGDYSGILNVGDVNGDGYTDLINGANENDRGGTSSGAAFVLLGPIVDDLSLSSADAILVGENADDWAGTEVGADGDVNADGVDDVVVSAPFNDNAGTDSGTTYLVYGPMSGVVDLSTADATFTGMASSDYSGWSTRIVQDTNADGHDEIFIGAPQQDATGSSAGAAYLILGSGL